MNRILILNLLFLLILGCSQPAPTPSVTPPVAPLPPQPISPLSQAQVFLRNESQTREAYWNEIRRLCTNNPLITLQNCMHGVLFNPHYTRPLGYTIRSASFENNSTVDDQTIPIIRQSTRGPQHEGRIYYNAYIRQDILNQRFPLKGVLIYAYGGASPIRYSPNNELSLERIMAAQGYLVYALNLRGAVSQDFDVEFIRSQGNAEGVATTARDVTYFATILKTPGAIDPYGNRPLYSDIIGSNPNLFFTGFSFGGYLSMYLATHTESFTIRGLRDNHGNSLGQRMRNTHFQGINVFHRTVFDGYIPMSGVSDQREDVIGTTFGLTTSGLNRQSFFNWDAQQRASHSVFQHQGQSVRTWMYNVFQDLDIINNLRQNQSISPYLKAYNAEKPILLMHGLHDDNTSPAQSTEFAKALLQNRARPLVTQYYEKTLGHHWPVQFASTKNWYETMLRFMDLVSFTKNHGGLQLTAAMQTQNEKIAHTAYFYFRAHHPNPSLQFTSHQFIYDQLIDFSNASTSSGMDFWNQRSIHAPNFQSAHNDWRIRNQGTRRNTLWFRNFFTNITLENTSISFQEIQNLENTGFLRSSILD